MRRSLEKPDDMTMCEFMSRIQEINEYFPSFPVDTEGQPVSKLSESELVEIGEYALPESWQNTMHLHNVDPLTIGVTDFIKFCERLETLDSSGKKDRDSSDKRKRKRHPTNVARRPDVEDDQSVEHYCLLHGPGNHTSENCFQLKGIIRNAKHHKSNHNESGTRSSSKHKKSKNNNHDSGKPS